MKVILSAIDVASMLAAQWNLNPEDVVLHNLEEVTIEIPATLLGLSEPQQQQQQQPKQQRKPRAATAAAATAAPSRKAAKEANLEEELKELEDTLNPEPEVTEDEPTTKDSLEQFMDDDEEAFT